MQQKNDMKHTENQNSKSEKNVIIDVNKINKKDNLFRTKYIKPGYFVLIITVALLIGYIFTYALKLDFSFVNVFIRSIVSTSMIWGGCMTIVTIMWKKFPWEIVPAKHLFFEILFISIFLCVYIIGGAFLMTCYEIVSFEEFIDSHSTEIIITVLISFLITTIHEAVFFYQQWKFNFSKSIRLEKDNIEAQYAALKAQVNPHFLFNSLNSLMSLLDNNPKAEQYVQDLSEYLRYVLLSNSREAVSLNEELENLEKFFHLQKLRFNENLHVDIQLNPASLTLQIPPLALQMLVDNCLKHNIISEKHPLHIWIFDDEKTITVKNNLQLKQNQESTGQGLKNIEGRYRFIGGESIKIESDEKYFSVTIPLITS